jgi:hypothetical protein
MNSNQGFESPSSLATTRTLVKLRLFFASRIAAIIQSHEVEGMGGQPPNSLNLIPKHWCGSVTTLQCIIKPMVMRNQEAQDSLKTYIKTFDITKFPSKHVPTTCLCLKAVACTLGDNDPQKNVVHKVLEGFTKLSTSSFNEFCASQIVLSCGSFYRTLMKSNSLQTQLNDVLNDLGATYIDLVGEI